MICAEAAIHRVRERRARELWQPADGPACPVQVGKPYGLQPRLFARAEVTITITAVATVFLAELNRDVAQRLGFAGIEGAMAELNPSGSLREHERFWALCFVLGDHSDFTLQDRPVYLHRNPAAGKSDYTTRRDKAAAGEPEALAPALLEPYVEQARIRELAAATNGSRFSQLSTTREDVIALARGAKTRKAKNRVRRILHDLDALAAEEAERYTHRGPAGEGVVTLA